MSATKTRGRQATKLKKGDRLFPYRLDAQSHLEVIGLADRGTKAKVRNSRTGKVRKIDAEVTKSLRSNYELPTRLQRRKPASSSGW